MKKIVKTTNQAFEYGAATQCTLDCCDGATDCTCSF